MDTKLTFKPIELLDVGIDKLTKMPVPILNENIVSTYQNENGIPINSFTFIFDSNYSNSIVLMTITTDYNTTLFFDWGDGDTFSIPILGDTTVYHQFTTLSQFEISVFGDLDKVTRLFINPIITTTGGVVSASLNNLRKLTTLDLSDNLLTSLNIEDMIYLSTIVLKNNYLYNDDIDDIYATADTIPLFNGTIDTTGTNNGVPSVYSSIARTNLAFKGWSLLYNT